MLSEKVTYTHTHTKTPYLHLQEILVKTKLQGQNTDQWVPGIGSGRRISVSKWQEGFFWVMEIFHILVILQPYSGFPGGKVVKNLPANIGDAGDPGSNPWVRKIPRNRKWQPIPVVLPGKFHEQRRLGGYSPWVSKSWTQLSTWVCAHAYTHTLTH